MTEPRSRPTLQRVAATFLEDGSVEVAISYHHTDDPPTPGTKGRTTTAARMAREGLEAALEGLSNGGVVWVGFGTNTRESTDHVIVERREEQAN
jgi:hypothetical protein